MLLVPPLIAKYREPVDVRFLVPGADQLNRSCGWRSEAPPMKDPKPRTSSISCSVDLCASKLLPGGRVNWKEFAEFRVTIPSNVRPKPPVEFKAPGVVRPSALTLTPETRRFG